MGEGRAHSRALCEHLGVRYFAHGYHGDALKVSWDVPLLPEHLLWFLLPTIFTELVAKRYSIFCNSKKKIIGTDRGIELGSGLF